MVKRFHPMMVEVIGLDTKGYIEHEVYEKVVKDRDSLAQRVKELEEKLKRYEHYERRCEAGYSVADAIDLNEQIALLEAQLVALRDAAVEICNRHGNCCRSREELGFAQTAFLLGSAIRALPLNNNKRAEAIVRLLIVTKEVRSVLELNRENKWALGEDLTKQWDDAWRAYEQGGEG